MTTLRPPSVSTRQFTYDGSTGTFVAEISSTNGLGRVYSDSVDEGLTLVSSRTGREIVFVVWNEQHNADGEVTFWELVQEHQPGSRFFYKMTLFND